MIEKLKPHQRKNLQRLFKRKTQNIQPGDKVRIRDDMLRLARCYMFAEARYKRIIGEVKAVHIQDGYAFVEIDFLQYHLPLRWDGKHHGVNAAPSWEKLGTKYWPLPMLEKVQ